MKDALKQKIAEALKMLQQEDVIPQGVLPEVFLERPKDEQFGEYTSNIALILAKQLGENPRKIADVLAPKIAMPELEKVEVAGPGHLNFYLSQKALAETVEEVLQKKERFGDSAIGQGIKINNEFISANPTGPLHLGNARGGFFADTLSRVLRKCGYEVVNEYYVNDAGEQVVKLGHSVLKDAEAVYQGEYIDGLHARFGTGTDPELAGKQAASALLEEMIKPMTKKMGIVFDLWTHEKAVIDEGYADKALQIFSEQGKSYEQDGALWLRTTQYGDDKDRVLIKGDKSRTYFASDCGHILQYVEQNFDVIIETFGADHHGYTRRFEAAARALGFKGEIRFILVQLVKLVKDGEEVRMSKRAGNVVSVDELLELVGVDVARFFFLMYGPGTHMNFDLGLAEERSQKNPVYYVQYAHARLASVLRKAEDEGFAASGGEYALLTHPKERELLRELLFFPELVEEVAREYGVQKLPQYAMRLSDKLHSFYADCRVIDVEQGELTKARLGLISAVKIVLGNTLDLMGIQAPEKM